MKDGEARKEREVRVGNTGVLLFSIIIFLRLFSPPNFCIFLILKISACHNFHMFSENHFHLFIMVP